MEVILDSNFIVSCVMKGIDFISQLEGKGFKILIPREVIQEIKDLRNKVNRDEKMSIDVALELIDRKKVKKVGLGEGRVDDWLVRKGKEGVYIASLDKEIKRQVPNRVVILASKMEVGVERD